MTRIEKEQVRGRFRAAFASPPVEDAPSKNLKSILGEFATGDWSADKALLLSIVDEANVEEECHCARNLDYDEDKPCQWWYEPSLGLDRERHPWEPDDLVARIRNEQVQE